jgi:hypothetical protein
LPSSAAAVSIALGVILLLAVGIDAWSGLRRH